jgi:2-(1,2-epoxy-1,2-dihydrophenyl)acetyl-CoA isomerase
MSAMSAEPAAEGVLEDHQDGVVVLTLNAPAKRNALIPAVREGLIAALTRLDRDPACRAIVITGAGGAFCAGGDISNTGPLTPLEVRRRIPAPQGLVKLILGNSKPVLAAVDGPAFGAGLALAAACDVVVAGAGATFCAAFGRIGVMADCGLLWSLPQRVGMGAVREIVMFCEVHSAAEALAMGLADRVAAEGQTLALALERARKLAAMPTTAIGMTKALLARAPLTLESVMAAEIDAQAVLSTTHDQQEGLRAFAEKRKPQFKGF